MIVTLTGPSCAGKTTLESMLRSKGFINVVSTTTREPRAQEVDGQSYYFVSHEDFLEQKAAGKFVESVEFNGNLYAVSKDELQRSLDSGSPVVIIVEPRGLKQIQDHAAAEGLPIVSYYVGNPLNVILKRFLDRFAADLLDTMPENKNRITDVYATRLRVMIEDECKWIDLTHLYDGFVVKFDETNAGGVMQVILNETTEKVAV